jgi:hypothetical protein
MRIDSSGNVGIGTNSPNTKLDVVTSGTSENVIQLRNATQTLALGVNDSSGGAFLFTNTNHALRFGCNGSEVGRFSNTGNFGIGTATPSEKLHIKGGGSGPEIRLEGTWGSHYIRAYNDNWNFLVGGTVNAINIKNNGNVGIGTTSPFSKLQVGNNTFSGGNGMYSDGRVGMSNHGSLTGLMLASTYNDAVHPEYGLVFVQGPSTSSYNVWSISPDGPAKGTGLNFHYQAQATNVHSPGNRVAGFTQHGLTFNQDTAAANALDDYEEGTFSTNPVSTNVTNYSFSGPNGRYTKIGRQVIVTFAITNIDAGTGNRYFVISQLPFAQHTASHNEQGFCSNYPDGQRRSGVIINNSSGNTSQWYVSWYNNTAQSGDTIRGTIIYTTT